MTPQTVTWSRVLDQEWATCEWLDQAGDLKRVVHLDPEVTDRAFKLGMTQQQLNGPQIL